MATTQQIQQFFKSVNAKSNRIIEIVLICYFVFGIVLSFFYDTYLVGIGVGALNLILYFGSKSLFGNSRKIQYVASLIFGVFMAQYIYQMHGLFEMHFTAFIAIIAMITYQNKYAFIPQVLFVVVHHSSFAYIQYLGVVNDNEAYRNIYFTQLEFMDVQTFLFHAGLYTLGVILAAVYAHNLEWHTTENAVNIIKMQENELVMDRNIIVANQIASGNLDIDVEISEGDKMGAALLEMKLNLKSSADRENEEKFINTGLARISEIIRRTDGNLEVLSNELIAFLVKYSDVNQGALFIKEDTEEEEFLSQTGCYAYDRKKFLEKKVYPGEGLLGQCYLEKEHILLREIPEGYINITSGLGKATPGFLILIPVKSDQMVEGVIELAGFRDFEQYKIQFLLKAAENIASVITSSKINHNTKILFEKSQEQTEMLRAQEEEMRQNMEELSATQEEMQRKTREFEARFNALNESHMAFAEFDMSGILTASNDTFIKLTGRHVAQSGGISYESLTGESSGEFMNLVTSLESSKSSTHTFRFTGNRNVQVHGSFILFRDDSGSSKSIIFYGMQLPRTLINSELNPVFS